MRQIVLKYATVLMDFLDPKKRKSHTRRLFIGYGLMAIAIGLAALVLLFATFGYGVDRKGNVFQNGLVFLASVPDGAEANITSLSNSSKQQTLTNDRVVLKADEYNFEMLKQGYRTWQRKVHVQGSRIERLDYALLFPNDLKTDNLKTYSKKPGLVTESPDRKTLYIQQPNTLATFDVIESNKAQTTTTIEVPSSVFPASALPEDFKLIEWSSDNRHLLVSRPHKGQVLYFIIDTKQPNQSVNINRSFKLSPKDVMLRDKNADELYMLLSDKRLVSAATEGLKTGLIARDIEDFSSHGRDTLLTVSSAKGASRGKVSVNIIDNNKTYLLRELPIGKQYTTDLVRYDDKWYMVTGSSADDNIYIYRDPIKTIQLDDPAVSLVTRTMRIADVTSVEFSDNSRFIAAQSGKKFVVYDSEKDLQYRYGTTKAFDNGGNANWMDSYRLAGIMNGKIFVFDFDGSNQQTLNSAVPDEQVIFNNDYSQLYSLVKSKSPAGYALTQTGLRVAE